MQMTTVGGTWNSYNEINRPSARSRSIRCLWEQEVFVFGAGIGVRRRIVRLLGEKRTPNTERGAQIFPTNHIGVGFLSFAFNLVSDKFSFIHFVNNMTFEIVAAIYFTHDIVVFILFYVVLFVCHRQSSRFEARKLIARREKQYKNCRLWNGIAAAGWLHVGNIMRLTTLCVSRSDSGEFRRRILYFQYRSVCYVCGDGCGTTTNNG